MGAWSGESILTYIPEPGLLHKNRKIKKSHTASLGSQLTCSAAPKANFLPGAYRKQRLEEEGEGSLRERKKEGE